MSGIALPISVLPPLSDARDHLHEFDLIVMPSRYEGLGLLALEALAAGTPVIATRVAGLREALPPDWPLWVPPDDPAALSAKIRVFFAGHVDLAEIFARGRKWVERFSSECANQRYVDACDTYLGKLASQGGSAAKRAPSDL